MPGRLNDDVFGSHKIIPKISLPVKRPNHMPKRGIWQNSSQIILLTKLRSQFRRLGNWLAADKAAADVGRCLII